MALDRALHDGLDLLGIGDVQADRVGLAAGAGDLLGRDRGPLSVPVGADDRGPGLGHALGGSPPDAAGRSGDDGDPTREIEGVHAARP